MRILKQSYEQGECMTGAQLGILLKISNATAGKYIRALEMENDELLPRGGHHTLHGTQHSHTKEK